MFIPLVWVASEMSETDRNRIVSVVDDEVDITELFHDALCENIDGISVVAFNGPIYLRLNTLQITNKTML